MFFGLFKKSFKVKWRGDYTVKKRKIEMGIKEMTCDEDGKLHGTGRDDENKFDIEGYYTPDGFLTFQKNYVSGLCSRVYRGRLQNQFLTGNWFFNGETGSFALELKDLKTYEAVYHREDQPNNPIRMRIQLILKDNGIFGMGFDNTGGYVVTANEIKSAEAYHFSLTYIKKFQVHHQGVLVSPISKKKKNGGDEVLIKGSWHNPQLKLKGTFEIAEAAAFAGFPQGPAMQPGLTSVQAFRNADQGNTNFVGTGGSGSMPPNHQGPQGAMGPGPNKTWAGQQYKFEQNQQIPFGAPPTESQLKGAGLVQGGAGQQQQQQNPFVGAGNMGSGNHANTPQGDATNPF